MPFNQAGETIVHRVPLAVDLQTRQSATLGTDPYLSNCFLETIEGKTFVVKRPGLESAYSYNGGGATNGQGMVYYKGLLFAMGSNTIYLLPSTVPTGTSGATWTQTSITATLPFAARSQFSGTTLNRRYYIMGGASAAALHNDVWSTDDFVTWKQEATACPWIPRSSAIAVTLNDRIYLIGGFGGSPTAALTDVWSSADGVTWVQETDDIGWTARADYRAAVYNNGIWLMGGVTGATWFQDVWFSSDGKSWAQLPNAASWSARSDFGITVFNGKLWIAGGRTAAVTYNNEVWYTTDGVSWTQTTAAAFAGARARLSLLWYRDHMWALGGYDGANLDDVYRSSDGVSWTLVTGAAAFGIRSYMQAVAFPTPTAVSAIRAWSIFVLGGTGAALLSSIYYGSLDTNQAANLGVTTTGSTSEQWQSAETSSGAWLAWKNTYTMYLIWAGNFYAVTDPNYPTRTVPGVENLNGTIYVMTPEGVIYGSFIENPLRWSSLNYITADYSSDAGVAIGKSLNYIVAFGKETIQFFYDSGIGATGTGEGTSLRPVQNATVQIGCASAGSIAPMDTSLIFMGRSSQAGRGVYLLGGTSPQKVSTPRIDRILNRSTLANVHSFCVEIGGHNFYVLTLVDLSYTLVWDAVERKWHAWVGSLDYFPGINYATDGASNWVQHRTLGLVYNMSPTVYGDAGATITCLGIGEKVDFGGNERKFCSGIEVIGDRRAVSSPNNLTLFWSDDDLQNTSAGANRTIDLTKALARTNRCGSFLRRNHYFTHVSATNPMRLEALELTIEPGDVR